MADEELINNEETESPNTESVAAGESPSAPPLQPIEKLIQEHGIRPWVAAGLMAEKKWAAGKQLTEAEFTSAVETYLKTPMAGPDKKE
ncbi:hypothetical protein M7775_02045 [Sporomusa sphaeroides DSM 2875]|uniref:hypothetical protein n=1 Tax=Sporomusa sphaeroides TaxID=47679 RepID=UPI00202E53B5|nr:hypothetical protein [Sporomusa sphaeroides]MCM0757349.1 hypothetical protein [Sporomusa sphaeroides DSM 2875]